METITVEERGAIPKQVKIVNIVYFFSDAEGVKPRVETEESTKTTRSTSQRGKWTRQKDSLSTAAGHINQAMEIDFQKLGAFQRCIVRSYMEYDFLDRW